MTRQEVLQIYNVPPDLLDKYAAIKKCTSYSDQDIENISMIMTLYDAGFDDTEVRKYFDFCLSDEDTADKRAAMLTKKRKHTLDEIHLKQKQLDGIDYLRYRVAKENKKMNIKNEMEEIKMSKKLVAYFSASGVTKRYAEKLAKAAGADLFEIKPSIPYTNADLNWQNSHSRSSVEMKNPDSRPEIAEKLPDMDRYDTVFVGFPIWWYVAPTIIDTFLESYDFSGKTVVPFATSGGSGMGKTADVLQKVCPDADIKDGKVLNGMSDEKIAQWANEF